MRTITTRTGVRITLDGDLLAIIESLYEEVTVKRQLDRSYEDMMTEIRHVVGQMSDQERIDYLSESLFHNTVRFENEKLAAFLQKLARPTKRKAGGGGRKAEGRGRKGARG